MAAVSTDHRGNSRLRFGAAEWIGLAALALTPACGFAWWGYQISDRMTTVEVKQQTVMDAQRTTSEILQSVVSQQGRLDERVKSNGARIERIERN